MKIVVLDIETTGFSSVNDCIVELGIVELDLETGEKTILYDQIIREEHFSDVHRGAWIFSNSDLKHSDVMDASPIDREKVQDILIKYGATAYNKSFDFRFLEHRGFIINHLACPMKVATPVLKIPGKYGHKWPSVTEAYKLLIGDKEYEEKHRGLSDAMDEADIVFKLYTLGHYKIGE